MKLLAKLICFALSVCVVTATAAGCGKKEKDEEGTVYIYVHNSGYGISFLSELSSAFAEKTGVKVKINDFGEESDLFTKIESGVTNADLMISSTSIFKYLYTSKKAGSTTYECLLEDLTPLYHEKIPGETQTIAEKMDKDYLSYHSFEKNGETKYYSMPWIKGINGILVNNYYWEPSWNDPRTTDELLELCDKIKASSKTPFIYCAEASYWSSGIAPIWAAQYMGAEEVESYNKGYDQKGNRYSYTMQTYDGFLEAMKVMQELLNDDKDYMSRLSKSLDFTSVQNEFLETKDPGTEEIVMIPNGDWIEREMNANYGKDEVEVRFIKMPVISALGDRLGINAPDDTVLKEIVDYVDGKRAEPPAFRSTKGYTSEEVVSAVRYARNLIPAYSLSGSAFIPVYANEKENAKKFLQFMASDEGIELFVKGSNGYILPYEYDYLGSETTKNYFSKLQKNTISILQTSTTFDFQMKDRIFALGHLALPGMNESRYYETKLSARREGVDYKSAEQIFFNDYRFVQNQWPLIKTNAGIAG